MTVRSLALCLDAPMQSWGLRGRSTIRDTATEPTKSGIVGLLCCALGVSRDDEPAIARLAALHLGIRVDREGILERDYQTVQQVPTTSGTGHRTVESHRYYLADALFLVVLGGPAVILDEVSQALSQPVWPLYLGRRAYVPTRPLFAETVAEQPHPGALTAKGLVGGDVESVLATHSWLEDRPKVREVERAKPERTPLRTVVDCAPGDPLAEVRYDHPVSYVRERRVFRARTVREGQVPLTDAMISEEVGVSCI